MRAHHVWMLLAVGCVSPAPTPGPLGIVSFEVRETTDTSTVIGRDADGREVGRLDLYRGPFTLSGVFAEDHDDPYVVGRRLSVRVLDQELSWETEGFTPTMGLPAHPASHAALAAFLDDPRVKPILERSGIAFEASADPPGYTCDVNGTNACHCVGTICPTLFGATPGACGGLGGSDYVFIVHQRATDAYHVIPKDLPDTHYDQSVVAQCCPYISDAQPAIFAKKTCPDSPTCSASTPCPSTCGPVKTPGKCTACPMYPSNGKCTMLVQDAGWSDPAAPVITVPYCGESTVRTTEAQQEVQKLCARFAWTCGDGFCDADEDCASCPADCAPPVTSCPADYQCGSIDNGCGGTVDCSGGQTCDQIMGKKHYECVEASHRCCKHARCKDDDDDD
jgi:hypothetical protein